MDEGHVVGAAHPLEVVEDREFGWSGGVDAPAQMVEIVAEQVEIGAAQETLWTLGRPGAELFDAEPSAALPGEAQRVIERMQHREAEMHPLDRQTGGGQAFAKSAHDRFEVLAGKGGLAQPVRDAVEKYG